MFALQFVAIHDGRKEIDHAVELLAEAAGYVLVRSVMAEAA